MHSSGMTALSLFAGVLACSLLLAAAAPAPEDAAAAATTEAPGTGPIVHAFETILKEGPERAKKFGEGLRANAEKIRGRIQEDFAKIVAPAAAPASPTKASLLHKVLHHKTASSTASATTSSPPTPSSGPTADVPPHGASQPQQPQPQDTHGPTTLSPTTTTVESRTLIGAPLRCGPGEKASKGKCREYL